MSHIGFYYHSWFNLSIMGNVLGIIGAFLEHHYGFFRHLKIAL